MSARFAALRARWMMLALVACALLLGGCATSASGGSEILSLDEMLSTGNWMPLAIASLLLSFFIVSIGYMLAEVFRMPTLNAWAKSEYYEVLISAFLLFSIFFFVALGESLAREFTLGENHIEFGKMYLENMKVLLELEIYPMLLLLDIVVGNFATLNFSLPFEVSALAIMVGTSPMAGLGMISNSLVFMLDTVGIFMATVIAQMEFLHFVDVFALGLFLPLGILMRTFPLTRKTGSTLIALSITIYFAYPLTLVFNQQVFDVAFVPVMQIFAERLFDVQIDDANTLAVNFEFSDELLPQLNTLQNMGPEEDFKPDTIMDTEGREYAETWQKNKNLKVGYDKSADVKPPDTQSMINWGTLWNFAMPVSGWSTMFYELLFTFYGPALAQAAVLALVLPIIDIIMCITFFRGLSSSIGGEAQIMGLTRII